MKKSVVRKIVVAGVLSAVAAFLGLTRLGYIPWFSGASLTVMHVPAIVGAVLEGPVVGAVIGLVYGLTSLLQAAIAPTGPLDPAFVNPLISVLPRLLVGPAAFLAYAAFRGKLEIPALGLSGIVGSLVNTMLVVGALALFGFLTWDLFWPVVTANGLPEAGAAALVNVAVVAAWKGVAGRGGKASIAAEEDR